MKEFIFKIVLFTGIVFGLFMGLILFIPVQPNDYFQAYNLKCKLLEETESPRVVFVGGSNLAFGLDCQIIKDSLGVNVVNNGLHAGVGLKFILDDVEAYLRKGDIVVIAPEYEHFYNPNGEAATIAPIQSVCRWKKLHLLNFAQMKNVITGLPRIFMHALPKPHNERRYVLSGFNEYGDEIKHWQLESISIPRPNPIKGVFDRNFGEYFVKKIEAFKEKGCAILIIPPVCRETAYEVKRKNIEEVCSFLNEQGLSFQVLPKVHAFSDNYAYDTDYHMTYEGVKRFSSSIVGILKPIIEVRRISEE